MAQPSFQNISPVVKCQEHHLENHWYRWPLSAIFWRIPVKTRVFPQQSMSNILTVLAALGITVKFVKNWLCLNSHILHAINLGYSIELKENFQFCLWLRCHTESPHLQMSQISNPPVSSLGTHLLDEYFWKIDEWFTRIFFTWSAVRFEHSDAPIC